MSICTKDKSVALARLNNEMMASCQCKLRYVAKNVVPGVGNADADILFIGEAPGKKEDEMGIPFVGASGKLLDELLMTIGLSRGDIYITNVVKYRPPNNRDPLPEEVALCWPWLYAQVKTIHPKLIVLLGRHALERFSHGRHISVEHGKVISCTIPNFDAYTFFALYHPAAALYNGSLRKILFSDFQRIPIVLSLLKEK